MEKKTHFIFFGVIILIIIVGIGFASNNTIDNNIILNETDMKEIQNTTKQ